MSYDNSEMKCECGKIQISSIENQRRISVWNDYCHKVSLSRACKRFYEQREALKGGNLNKVKELALEAKEDLLHKKDWIAKPNFPDPQISKCYEVSCPSKNVINDF